jgi:hypothetical protein
VRGKKGRCVNFRETWLEAATSSQQVLHLIILHYNAHISVIERSIRAVLMGIFPTEVAIRPIERTAGELSCMVIE